MAGGRHESGPRSGTPRAELARIREGRERQAEEARESILTAMLACCGEKGYRRVSVQDVIDRYGGNRVQFYRQFGSKGECYAAAHEAGLERLCARLLEAGAAAPGWREGLRAALAELAAFAAEDPAPARGLVVEAHVAGGEVLEVREAACERLARAVDRGREEGGPHLAPPAISARFMVGAVDSALSAALSAGRPEQFGEAVPGLAHLIVATYLGEDAAAEELAAARAA